MLEVGKLYSCKKYYLFLYPDANAAAVAACGASAFAVSSSTSLRSIARTVSFSKEMGLPISYCVPETPILVLNVSDDYAEILATDKVGWIVNREWLDIEELR